MSAAGRQDLAYLRGLANGLSERVAELAARQDIAADTAQRRADYVLREVLDGMYRLETALGTGRRPSLKAVAGCGDGGGEPVRGHLRAVPDGAS